MLLSVKSIESFDYNTGGTILSRRARGRHCDGAGSVVTMLLRLRVRWKVILLLEKREVRVKCEGWNLNSGNYLFTTDTK